MACVTASLWFVFVSCYFNFRICLLLPALTHMDLCAHGRFLFAPDWEKKKEHKHSLQSFTFAFRLGAAKDNSLTTSHDWLQWCSCLQVYSCTSYFVYRVFSNKERGSTLQCSVLFLCYFNTGTTLYAEVKKRSQLRGCQHVAVRSSHVFAFRIKIRATRLNLQNRRLLHNSVLQWKADLIFYLKLKIFEFC